SVLRSRCPSLIGSHPREHSVDPTAPERRADRTDSPHGTVVIFVAIELERPGFRFEGSRRLRLARKTFHEDQPRDQALFARSHPGRVDELLGRVVDGAALATWRVQDVEQAWIDPGWEGWRQLVLVGDGSMVGGEQA